jgi:TnpA family transposase
VAKRSIKALRELDAAAEAASLRAKQAIDEYITAYSTGPCNADSWAALAKVESAIFMARSLESALDDELEP